MCAGYMYINQGVRNCRVYQRVIWKIDPCSFCAVYTWPEHIMTVQNSSTDKRLATQKRRLGHMQHLYLYSVQCDFIIILSELKTFTEHRRRNKKKNIFLFSLLLHDRPSLFSVKYTVAAVTTTCRNVTPAQKQLQFSRYKQEENSEHQRGMVAVQMPGTTVLGWSVVRAYSLLYILHVIGRWSGRTRWDQWTPEFNIPLQPFSERWTRRPSVSLRVKQRQTYIQTERQLL